MTIHSKDPAEIITVTFPYANEIGAAVHNTQSVTVEIEDGADAAKDAMLNGAQQVSGSSVLQSVRNGVHGVRYKLRCEATLSDGRKLVRVLSLPVIRR